MVYFISNYADKYSSSGVQPATINDLLGWMVGKHVLQCDTETTGDFNFSNKVIMLQIGNSETQFVIDTRCIDISPVLPYFRDESILWLFQNAKFDLKFLRFSFGETPVKVYDTFLAECLLTNGIKNRSLGLSHLVQKYTGAYMDKNVRSNFINKGSTEFTKEEVLYGAMDVQYLEEIREKQLEEITKLELNNVLDLENEVTHVLADIEYNGMKLDSNKWIEQADRTEELLEKSRNDLDDYILTKHPSSRFVNHRVQLTMFDEVSPVLVNINWDSPVQVKQLLTELGINTKTTSAKDIESLASKHEIIRNFIDYKKTSKLVSTYGKSFLKYINPVTGRVHTNFWQILDTARVSSGGSDTTPNMQNLPANNLYRNPFVAKPGFKIVSCDFSGRRKIMTFQY